MPDADYYEQKGKSNIAIWKTLTAIASVVAIVFAGLWVYYPIENLGNDLVIDDEGTDEGENTTGGDDPPIMGVLLGSNYNYTIEIWGEGYDFIGMTNESVMSYLGVEEVEVNIGGDDYRFQIFKFHADKEGQTTLTFHFDGDPHLVERAIIEFTIGVY